jgi:membrane-bound lytic murein transglycosylase B
MDRRLFMGLAGAMMAMGLPRAGAAQEPSVPVLGAPSGDLGFDGWLADFKSRALAGGWSQDLLERELTGLTPDPRVLGLDRRQPELSKPIGDYIRGVVADDRITMGQARRASLTGLSAIEARFGVPGQVLVAIWGVETGFGAVMGQYDVIRSMATLAAQGRRRAWAEAQILAALKIISAGEATREQLKGSWAGAMGQTQFLPETYVSTAVDFEGDGRRDIWGSSVDALASAANLLLKGGWKPGQPWAREVLLPEGFDLGLSEGPNLAPTVWAGLGLRPADGWGWTAKDADLPASLILPAGAKGPAFLIFANHMAIRSYNNATAYALAVGLLADRIAGAAPLVTPWPVETPLSHADRVGAQLALAQLGFDVGAADGVIGLRTRKALRSWQASVGIGADGYLTLEGVQALMAMALMMPS